MRAVCALLCVIAVVPAVASADVEPNSSIFDAEGPLAGGQAVAGTLDVGDTDDWYILYVEGVHQLHLVGTIDGDPGCGKLELTDEDGNAVARDYTSSAGTTLFYVHVARGGLFCQPASAYTFQVDPAVAVVPGAGKLPIKGTAEPNESRSEASGPLSPGAWHFGSLQTANDQDWLRFYVHPDAGRVKVAVVAYNNGHCVNGHRISLTGATGEVLRSRNLSGQSEPVIRFDQSVTRGGKLFVHSTGSGFDGCVGAVTVVQVGPEEAVMSSVEVRSACAAARKRIRRLTRLMASERRIARGTGNRAALRRKLARHKRKLRSARRSMKAYC